MTIPLEPKAIHDEMNSTTFDEFGRMTANLGIEAVPPAPGQQNVTLYPYVAPATELVDATNLPKGDGDVKAISNARDGTQIWKFTHNGVDTHPIHFHLYDVQVLNRVAWDNNVTRTEASELGWKDTVRMSPLEDTIVALRPIIPKVPFEVPNAIRPLNPMMPIGDTTGSTTSTPGHPDDPITNKLVNFGWEYVIHCHILSHEEMDMMRPESVALPPVKPVLVSATLPATGKKVVTLTWNDTSITETAFLVQRTTNGSTWTTVGTVPVPLTSANVHQVRTFTDGTSNGTTAYSYRVVAENTVGYGGAFPGMTVTSVSNTLNVNAPAATPAAPTTLTAAVQAGPQVALTWRDNATTETGFVIERAPAGSTTFVRIAVAPARNNTGNQTFDDTTIATGTPYWYRVAAVNLFGGVSTLSAYSNTATTSASPAVPAAPSNLAAANGASQGNKRSVTLTWKDNSANETGFTIQRATDAAFTTGLTSTTVAANAVTATQTGLSKATTYYFRIRANNAVGSSAWVNATPFPIVTQP